MGAAQKDDGKPPLTPREIADRKREIAEMPPDRNGNTLFASRGEEE